MQSAKSIKPLLLQAIAQNQLHLPDSACDQLVAYVGLLQHWNRVMNLTALTRPHDIIYLHLIDSLIIAPYIQGTQVLDVGSGAGLPGIPLAILDPSRHWTLLDKNAKKTHFLIQAAAELGLTHVQVIKSRCEDFHPAQGFDSILSRAFTTLTAFVDLTKHLICRKGVFLAMKGKYPREELNALPRPYAVQHVTPLKIEGMPVERHLVALDLYIPTARR